MLFDGAIRYALDGRQAILDKDFERTYENLSRAQRIVMEMQSGLRPDVNAELSGQMSSLYDFIYRKLVDASVKRDVGSIDDAVKILRHLRESWVMLMEKVSRVKGGGGDVLEFEAMVPGSLSVEG